MDVVVKIPIAVGVRTITIRPNPLEIMRDTQPTRNAFFHLYSSEHS